MSFDPGASEKALLERCAELCGRAADAGADAAEAFGSHGETVAVSFEKNDLKLAQVDEGRSFGLRVLVDGKLGFASTNQGDPESLAQAAREAVGLARLSVPDPHHCLPAPRALPDGPSLVHPAVLALGVDDAVERGRDLLQRTLAVDPRISIDTAGFSVNRGARAVHSSLGVSGAESDAAIGLNLFGMAVDGDDVGGFDYWGDTVRDPARLEPAIDETVRHFTGCALGNLGARAAESYTGPVLFSPQAFLSVFVGPLIGAASGLAVQRGRSALAGRLGERIAAEALTIRDDPSDPELAGASRFDREGQPASPFSIVERGVLRGYLYNAYAAHVDGCESTGHAAGGARSLPGLSPHAPVVSPGDAADLMRTLDRGLYLQRFSGTVDPASGDFSGVAKSARWIDRGAPDRPLKETLIAGNIFELLPRITALAATPERVTGRARVPAAIVDGVSVTAG